MTNVCGFRGKRTTEHLVFSEVPKRAHIGSLASRKSEVWSNIKEKKKSLATLVGHLQSIDFPDCLFVYFFNHLNKLRHLLKFQVMGVLEKVKTFPDRTRFFWQPRPINPGSEIAK